MRAPSLNIQLLNSINPFRLEGTEVDRVRAARSTRLGSARLDRAPGGNLGNTSAFGKALREAKALGLIARVPRIAAIQAAGAAPFARSFADHFAQRIRVEPETLATAIRIGAPASWDRAVRAILETNGVVTSVHGRPDSRGEGGDRRRRSSGASPASAAECCRRGAAEARGRDWIV
jgi:threonine synthase